MYLLTYNRSEAKDLIVQKWGDFNYFPPQWEDITNDLSKVEAVKRRLLDIDFYAVEYRQMHYPEECRHQGRYVAATLFFSQAENGFALAKVYNSKTNSFEDRYYVFGCQHKKSSTQILGRCYYGNTCQDCGYYWTVDSSD